MSEFALGLRTLVEIFERFANRWAVEDVILKSLQTENRGGELVGLLLSPKGTLMYRFRKGWAFPAAELAPTCSSPRIARVFMLRPETSQALHTRSRFRLQDWQPLCYQHLTLKL